MQNSVLVTFLLFSSLVFAQTKSPSPKHTRGATSPSADKLISIQVRGTQRYAPEEVIASSGLQLGENVSEENFKQATQKLAETGMFTNLGYTYSFSPAGTKLELQVNDNEQLVPVRFDNLVWYADQDLIDRVHSRIPLFKGQVPAAGGGLIDQVADVIAALLAERNPQFHLNYLQSGDSPGGGAIQSVVFSVSGAKIRIRNMNYPGASPSQLPALSAVTKKILGADYVRSNLARFAKLDLRPIYLSQGYLKVNFGQAQAQVITHAPDETLVDVKLPIDEGHQYKLAKIEWSGNTIFPAEKLQPLIHVQPSQLANAVQLSDDFEAVRRLYGTRGYVAFQVHPQPEFSDDENTVVYAVQIQEGDLYRMGDIDIEGLDEKATARLRNDWTLRRGEPYDSSYPKRFLDASARHLPTSVRWSISVRESLNDDDKTVDVTLHLTPQGG